MITSEDDLKMMASPNKWPVHPLLPVKRHRKGGGFPECGVMVTIASERFKVFRIAMYKLEGRSWSAAELCELPHEVYNSFEEIVAAGWMVD